MLYFLSQGSNLGNRAENFRRALSELQKLGEIKAQSPVYESEPWGFESENWFWNMVLALESALSPQELIEAILNLEIVMGRKRTPEKGYSSRVIDIDILSVENVIENSKYLHLPHPRLSERRFVLAPWANIAPDYLVPGKMKTVAQLLAECTDKTICRKIQDATIHSL